MIDSEKLDDKIRLIVKEELVACFGDILYLMEQYTAKTDRTGNIVKDKRAYTDKEIIEAVKDKLEYDIEEMERDLREE
jgi:hypothetical protein